MTIITSVVTVTAGAIIMSSNSIDENKPDSFAYTYTADNESMLAYNDSSAVLNKMSIVRRKNFEKLSFMRSLKDDWDGEGSIKPFTDVIDNVEKFIDCSNKYQPNIFPTPEGYIQIEFYNGEKKYLQFIVTDSEVEIYLTSGEGSDNDFFESVRFSIDTMLRFVYDFYGDVYECKDVLWTGNR